MKKKLTLTGLALVAVFALSGCYSIDGKIINNNDEGTREFTYHHSDGRVLDCIKHYKGMVM